MDATAAATVGHNRPNTLISGDDLAVHLKLAHADLFNRASALMETDLRLPKDDTGHIAISNDDQDGKATELVVMIQKCVRAMEGARVAEKAPYDEAAAQVHTSFRNPMDKLDGAQTRTQGLKQRIEQAQTEYKRAVAKIARDKAEAEARARREAERLAQAEADRKAAEARAADEAAAEAARAAARKRTPENVALANEAADRAKAQAAAADAAAADAKAVEEQAAADRAAAEKTAAAPASDFSRQRGERVGVSSLRTFWNFRDLDRDQIDLEALRDHLPQAAIETALRAYIAAGNRSITGATIFEDTKAVNRA